MIFPFVNHTNGFLCNDIKTSITELHLVSKYLEIPHLHNDYLMKTRILDILRFLQLSSLPDMLEKEAKEARK